MDDITTNQENDTEPESSVFDIWNELYKADENIVKQAAEKLTSAKQYLEKRNLI